MKHIKSLIGLIFATVAFLWTTYHCWIVYTVHANLSSLNEQQLFNSSRLIFDINSPISHVLTTILSLQRTDILFLILLTLGGTFQWYVVGLFLESFVKRNISVISKLWNGASTKSRFISLVMVLVGGFDLLSKLLPKEEIIFIDGPQWTQWLSLLLIFGQIGILVAWIVILYSKNFIGGIFLFLIFSNSFYCLEGILAGGITSWNEIFNFLMWRAFLNTIMAFPVFLLTRYILLKWIGRSDSANSGDTMSYTGFPGHFN